MKQTERSSFKFWLSESSTINIEPYISSNKLLHVFEFGIIISREAFTTIWTDFYGGKFLSCSY